MFFLVGALDKWVGRVANAVDDGLFTACQLGTGGVADVPSFTSIVFNAELIAHCNSGGKIENR